VLDEPGLVEMLKHRARKLNQAHVHPLGALTVGLKGEALTEMAELTGSGCIGFSQAEEPIEDTNVLLRAMQYAKTFGYTVWLRPQDAHIGRGGVAASVRWRRAWPVRRAGDVRNHRAAHHLRTDARHRRARAPVPHFVAAALELIRRPSEGLPVTCDVGVHHVHLTDADIGFFDSNARMDAAIPQPARPRCDPPRPAGRHHRRAVLGPHAGGRR
jgi:dihydroorotase